jgi:hypothetical protein
VLPTATPNPTAVAASNTRVFKKTVYNTNASPVQIGDVTMTYLDKTDEINGFILDTVIYPKDFFSTDTISITKRVVRYTTLTIPAGGSVTFYVFYKDKNVDANGNPISTNASDFTSLSVEILELNSCIK